MHLLWDSNLPSLLDIIYFSFRIMNSIIGLDDYSLSWRIALLKRDGKKKKIGRLGMGASLLVKSFPDTAQFKVSVTKRGCSSHDSLSPCKGKYIFLKKRSILALSLVPPTPFLSFIPTSTMLRNIYKTHARSSPFVMRALVCNGREMSGVFSFCS